MAADGSPIAAKRGTEPGAKLRLLTLADLDGRTTAARRAEELRDRVLSERGGAARVDVVRRVHTESWAIMSALIEDQLARLLRGEAIELYDVTRLVNARRREGEVIGQPEPRDVTPTVHDYVASLADAEAETEAAE
jgi:hypothetical protein